jgi:surface protein
MYLTPADLLWLSMRHTEQGGYTMSGSGVTVDGRVPVASLVNARYQFQIDGVIAATVLRALDRVASSHLTSRVALLAVGAVEESRNRLAEASEDQRLTSLDALSSWDTPSVAPGSTYADVVARSVELIDAAGSGTLRVNLGDPLRTLAA